MRSRWLLAGCLLFLPALVQAATITLAWDAPVQPGHDGYAVSRKLGQGGTPSEIGKVGLVLTYVDATAPQGQIVCYTVASTLGTQRSVPSNEVCAATIQPPLTLRIQ